MCTALPDTPSNVSVLEESSTWVRLSAEPPRQDGGMPVSHWSVKYELADSVPRGHSSSRLFTNGQLKPSSHPTQGTRRARRKGRKLRNARIDAASIIAFRLLRCLRKLRLKVRVALRALRWMETGLLVRHCYCLLLQLSYFSVLPLHRLKTDTTCSDSCSVLCCTPSSHAEFKQIYFCILCALQSTHQLVSCGMQAYGRGG